MYSKAAFSTTTTSSSSRIRKGRYQCQHYSPSAFHNKVIINFTRQSLQFLLFIILFFITVNFFTLSVFERRLVTFALLKEEGRACREPAVSKNTSPRLGEQEVEEELVQHQVISMEEYLFISCFCILLYLFVFVCI